MRRGAPLRDRAASRVEETVSYTLNRASAAEIGAHLFRCDTDFTPPLTARLDTADYSAKIVKYAERFEAWAAGQLVGLVAAYLNDVSRRDAFVTSVSVDALRREQGIGGRLMNECIRHARQSGFKRLSLRVHRQQASAIGLYGRHGFVPVPAEAMESDIMMILELTEAAASNARL